MNLLLEHGCDPSKPNNREQSPLHLAALQGHRACVAALLKAGADPMLGDQVSISPPFYEQLFCLKVFVAAFM